MKKILLLATLVLGMVSCMKDQSLDANLAGDGNFVLSVALPDDATRAAGTDSAKGAVDNGIIGEYDVRYTLEVYDANGALAKEAQHTVKAASTSFELRLIPGRHYRFVVWADFVKCNAAGEVTLAYYDVTDLTNVTLTGTHNAMNESRDAYTAVFNTAEERDKDVFSSASTIKMTLTRPFAKLRVVTNDMNEIKSYSTLQSATVKYTTPIYTGFNALDAKVTGATESNVEKTVVFTNDAYKYEGEPTVDGVQTLFADYIFGTETGTVQFTLDVADDVAVLPQVAFNTAIPVKRNYLTTIYGPVLTDFNKVTVDINNVFDGEYENNVGAESKSVEESLKKNSEVISIDLTDDVALNGNGVKWGGEDTKLIIIDGQNVATRAAAENYYTLTFNTTYRLHIETVNPDAKVILRNLNVTTNKESGTWDTYDIQFNCNVDIENVNFQKAVAFVKAGQTVTMKNVTINETNDYYAMWITAEGQTVDIDGLTINSDGRGIKIDEEYLDAPAKVTLNINDADFNTKKKAAIIVKSVAGADITLSNVDITGVAADKVNAVWVDEDAKNYFDKVNVVGGSMAIEGKNTIEGEDAQAALNAAVTTENAVVQLAAGKYAFPKNFAKGVTVICAKGTEFTGTSNLNINGATVIGATFQSGSNDLVANDSTINGTYKNCVFNGDLKFSEAGDTVVFENCVFNGPDYALHFDTAVANSHVILKGCEVNSEWRVAIGAAVSMFEAIDTKFNVAGFINLWGKAKFTNCAFNKPYYWICSMDYTEYTNCTCEDRALVADDIRIEDTVIKINDEFYASNNESLKIALEKNASVVNLLDGNYELSGLNFVANNVTLKGVDKANVVLNIEKSIYLQNKSVTLENLTYNLNAGKGYDEHAFAFVHHATAFNLKNCNVNRLRLNVYEANIEDCTFTLDTSSGFDGYCIYYYGNDNSTVNVKNSTFATAGKGICIYSESAKAYNLNVDKCSFTSSNSATDKAAIQMHTECGISGNVKITETTATGFAAINGGLWNELNNGTGVPTDKFDIWVDGTQVH